MKVHFLLFLSLCSLCIISPAQQQFPDSEELGEVHWYRDFEQALAQAEAQEKAVFILFQEVPGCATCRNYGQHVMSHPLIVEAIEDLFIPLAIFNNKKGKDAEVLGLYHEPSWNNPVLRIVNDRRQNIVQRVSGNYSRLGVVKAMIAALEAQQKPVPRYVELLREEFSAEQSQETAYFSMYCFWSGEKQLGAVTGVVASEAGFMNGREVVKVQYDPQVISDKSLNQQAVQASCSPVNSVGKFRLDREPKYYLAQTSYRFLPMTALQATQANSLVGDQTSPEMLFSPRQLSMLSFIESHQEITWKSQIQKPLYDAWQDVFGLIQTNK